MATNSKLYTVAGILVEATKSEGGGFYELTVVETGQKQRYLAEAFESVAKPAPDGWTKFWKPTEEK